MWQLPNVADVGITPACAGKMRRDRAHRCGRRDPPRLCGEKMFCRAASAAPIGSPPLTRGKVWRWRSSAPRPGITPAYAGKRLARPSGALGRSDHPRLCGEKSKAAAVSTRAAGSPPLVRGKAIRRLGKRAGSRITPACAGKSPPPPLAANGIGDHPRLRGEKLSAIEGRAIPSGSPPLARGKGFLGLIGGGQHGITPACAGKRR